MTSENLQKTTVEEVSTVEICNSCGIDLSDIEPSAREQCVLYDLEYGLVEKNVVAEIMDCPKFRARIKGRFPENRSGPLQYGVGLQALVINLLVAQMLSLRRLAGLVQAISGIELCEATCPGNIRRIYNALEPWEAAAKERLLTRPAIHADETGHRVNCTKPGGCR